MATSPPASPTPPAIDAAYPASTRTPRAHSWAVTRLALASAGQPNTPPPAHQTHQPPPQPQSSLHTSVLTPYPTARPKPARNHRPRRSRRHSATAATWLSRQASAHAFASRTCPNVARTRLTALRLLIA